MDSNNIVKDMVDGLHGGWSTIPINFLTGQPTDSTLERPVVVSVTGRENSRTFNASLVTSKTVTKVDWLITGTGFSYTFSTANMSVLLPDPVLHPDYFYVARCQVTLDDSVKTDWSRGFTFKTEKEFDYLYGFMVVNTGHTSGAIYSIEEGSVTLRNKADFADIPGRGTACTYFDKKLYVGHTDGGCLTVYNRNIGQVSKESTAITSSTPYSIAVNSESKEVAIASAEGPYLTVNGIPAEPDLPGPGTGVVFSRDGDTLWAVSAEEPYLFKYTKPYGVWTLSESASGINTPLFSLSAYQNGEIILAGGSVYLQDLTLFESLVSGEVWCSDISQDGNKIALGLEDSPYLKIFNIIEGIFTSVDVPSALPGPVRSCKFTRDGSHLIVGHRRSPYLTVLETTNYTKLNTDVFPEGTVWDICTWQNTIR